MLQCVSHTTLAKERIRHAYGHCPVVPRSERRWRRDLRYLQSRLIEFQTHFGDFVPEALPTAVRIAPANLLSQGYPQLANMRD